MLGGLGEEPEGPINETYRQEQRCRQRAHTLAARGDNQQGAIGQPTRWSAPPPCPFNWIAKQHEASLRLLWLHGESTAAAAGIINVTILIAL